MNPAAIMKMITMKNKFEKAHPKFASFIQNVVTVGVPEGSVIDITITRPDGSTVATNMKVQPSDIELIQEIKKDFGK